MTATQPKLVIENQAFAPIQNKLMGCIGDTRQETCEAIRETFPSFKCGFGGSHVWVSTCDNERIAIIYFE